MGFVPEEVFLQRVGEIARNALGDACTGSNPRKPSEQEHGEAAEVLLLRHQRYLLIKRIIIIIIINK